MHAMPRATGQRAPMSEALMVVLLGIQPLTTDLYLPTLPTLDPAPVGAASGQAVRSS